MFRTILSLTLYYAVNTSEPADYAKLIPRLDALHENYKTNGNTLYYLSTPPAFIRRDSGMLAEHGLKQRREWLETSHCGKTVWL